MPLGDVLDRRKLVPSVMLCAAVAAVLCAVSPSLGFLMGALVLLGVTTVSGQILALLAGDLADDSNRGHVVGTVVSGILVSRTVAGLVAGAAGSAIATVLWAHGGWLTVSIAGMVMSAFALTVWAVGRRGALIPV